MATRGLSHPRCSRARASDSLTTRQRAWSLEASIARQRVRLEPTSAAAATANAAAAKADAASDDGRGNTLLAWMRAQGAYVHPSVRLVYGSSNGNSSSSYTRTLIASSPLKSGEQLAVVPARLCLRTTGGNNADDAADAAATDNDDPALRPLLSACPNWQWRSAVTLLHHAIVLGSDKSPLAGYLPHLPGWARGVPLPQLPLLWSSAELRELQGALPAAAAARGGRGGADAKRRGGGGDKDRQEEEDHADRRRRFAREHLLRAPAFRQAVERQAAAAAAAAGASSAASSTPSPSSMEDAGERLLAWALAVVTSRSFGVGGPAQQQQQQQQHVMVPLVDMADHRPAGDAALNAEVVFGGLQEDEEGGKEEDAAAAVVLLKAARDVSAGEPLAICYGPHGPADTLLSYGFLLPTTPPPTPTAGPPVRLAWDSALLLAAFEALVAEAGPGVSDARDLPGWQRRALEAIFARGEEGGEEEEEEEEGGGGDDRGAAKQVVAAAAASKRGGSAKAGFGSSGARAANKKAAPSSSLKAGGKAPATMRLGGDPSHTPDARLVGAARLLALVRQDPQGVGAAVRRMVEQEEEEAGGGLSRLCAAIGGSGDDDDAPFPISAAHEAVAARALAGYCALAYRRAFRTTIQEDEKLLQAVVAAREAGEAEAAAEGAEEMASSSPPPLMGAATARDLRERRELALRFRLAAKRELERVAQTAGAHLKRALARVS
jgi:hypothetical protein